MNQSFGEPAFFVHLHQTLLYSGIFLLKSQILITVDQREMRNVSKVGVLAADEISKDASSSLSDPNIVKDLYTFYGYR
jgi:hypothetical protein